MESWYTEIQEWVVIAMRARAKGDYTRLKNLLERGQFDQSVEIVCIVAKQPQALDWYKDSPQQLKDDLYYSVRETLLADYA